MCSSQIFFSRKDLEISSLNSGGGNRTLLPIVDLPESDTYQNVQQSSFPCVLIAAPATLGPEHNMIPHMISLEEREHTEKIPVL
jgi:hypothetical protein